MLIALAACGKTGTSAEQVQTNQNAIAGPAERVARSAADNGDDAPFYTNLPMNEFMAHAMQFAGDSVWKWQGYLIDQTGEHSLFPKNDEEWFQAESGALALAEMSNVLLIPGRRVPEREWDNAVEAVRKAALAAAAAAERHDTQAFFDAGGALDEACDVCHARYDPSFPKQP